MRSFGSSLQGARLHVPFALRVGLISGLLLLTDSNEPLERRPEAAAAPL